MLTKRTRRKMQHWVAYLREHAPTDLPVVVRLSKPPSGFVGLLSKTAKRYTVYIEPNMAFAAIMETLGHEWAHALAYDKDGYDQENFAIHGDHWGKANAFVYRLWLEWREVEKTRVQRERRLRRHRRSQGGS